MPIVFEKDLSGWEVSPCFECNINAGDILLCGEGMCCISCYSSLTGISESDLMSDEEFARLAKPIAKESLEERKRIGQQ